MSKKNKEKISTLLKQEREKKEKALAGLTLNDEQKERYNIVIQHIENAKNQRSQPRDEFDGMTYEQDYFYNKRAANAYLPPKRNDDEVRVNTGTTEKKVEVLINELTAMNFQPEGKVYDVYDNEIKHLGDDFIDIVKRTNEMENDDDFWIDFLRELVTQRAVFVQELTEVKNYYGRTFKVARKELVSGLRVYLGDINIPARRFQEQPYIVLYTRRNYYEAQTIYKDWTRWKYVVPGMPANSNTPYGYRMNNIGIDEVEELHYMNPITNSYEIIINGVPMMENPKQLPYKILPDRKYNMTMIVVKSMDTDFAYGKPPVASAKFLQGLKDEIIRNLIRKFRQALEPPLAVRSGKIYSKDIWTPGAMAYGISKDDFEKLIDHNGVTQSEFAIYDLIEKKTEEFIGAGSLQQGIPPKGEQTATEIKQLQINSIKNLGHIVAAYMRAKRDATYLRIFNLLDEFVSTTGKRIDPLTGKVLNVYRRFTIDGVTFENGKKGKKIVQFIDSPLTEEEKENIFAYEQKEEIAGRPIRIRAINVKLLKSIPLFWKVNITSQPRDGSDLQKVLFKDKLEQGMVIMQASGGEKKINWDRVVDDFENTWHTRDFFAKESPLPSASKLENNNVDEKGKKLLEEIGNFERSSMGSQMTETYRRPIQKPSLNRLEDNIK